jgi:hypothetical protein
MLPSFRSLRSSRSLRTLEREALAPLLALAQAKGAAERRAWLQDLREEAPTVAATLELLLSDAESPGAIASQPAAHPSPSSPPREPGVDAPAELPGERRLPYRPPAISPGLAR